MSDEFWKNLPAILTALGVILTAYWAYRSKQNSKEAAANSTAALKQSQENHEQMEELQQSVYGMSMPNIKK